MAVFQKLLNPCGGISLVVDLNSVKYDAASLWFTVFVNADEKVNLIIF